MKWINLSLMYGHDFLWSGRFHDRPHISTRRQWPSFEREGEIHRLEPSAIGTHSMRLGKVAQIYKTTGKPRVVQLLPGHTKMDSTVRYLGVNLEDSLSISESVEI